MSVPQDKLMELMRSQQQQPGAAQDPTSSAPNDTGVPPMGSPMSTPEPKMGSKEGAMVNLSMARDLIMQAVAAIGSDSEEGKSALRALSSLDGVLGSKKAKTDELQQSEILQMLQSLPQAGGMPPEAKAMMQSPTQGVPQGMPQPGSMPQQM